MIIRRYHALNNHVLENIFSKKIGLTSVYGFNDPLESLFSDAMLEYLHKNDDIPFKEEIHGIITNTKVACFSEHTREREKEITAVERLMWAHYANSHKGICLEFEYNQRIIPKEDLYIDQFSDFSKERTYAFSIKYNDILGRLDDISISNWNSLEEIILSTFFYKDNAFCDENEFRIIQFSNNKGVSFFGSMEAPALRKIIFGVKCPENMIKIIRKISGVKNVEYYHITKSMMEEKEN